MTVSRTAIGSDRSVSTVVVEAVAQTLGVSPIELDPPLHRVVNPDALDDLFDRKWPSKEPTRVTFMYAGCEVTVHGGEIVVRPDPDPDQNPPVRP